MEGYWVWCGSVIKAEGKYHMFASRWSKRLPMHPGWMFESEIVRAVSDTPEGPYQFEQVVLPARGAQYWDGRATHNPHIKKIGNKFVLFYTGITHPFPPIPSNISVNAPETVVARTTKRIGIAVSDSITGPFQRANAPILHTRPDYFDSLLTSNPAPCVEDDGSILLMYKARAYLNPPYQQSLHGKMTMGVAKAASWQAPFVRLSDQPIFDETSAHMEDPYIWKTAAGYHMIGKDMDGRVCGQKHGGLYGFSKDGVHWEMKNGVLAYSRTITWDDGTVEEMGSLERPFILFEEGRPTHLFFATSNGKDGFMDATETWNMVIPLK